MDDKPKTGAERQRDYHARMRAAGLTRLSVWVPKSRKADFKAKFKRLQRQWKREGSYNVGK